jgi:hypothetical protein
MTRRIPRTRALGAAALLALVAVAGIGAVSVRADDHPVLPPVTAQELLASTIDAASRPASISGDVTSNLDLGLPQLPASLGVGVGLPSVITSVLGEQRWKVWSSPDGLRVAHLLPAREQDLVVNPTDAWWWDSAALRAIHLDLAALHRDLGHEPEGPAAGDSAAAPTPDPVQLARTLIDGVAPCASLSVQGTERVAGRDAYVLALIPLSSDSFVGSIRVSIDAETRLPLRVEVRAAGSDDAPISSGFTSVSFGAVDPAMFAFDPPPGADVRDASDPAEAGGDRSASSSGDLPAITDTQTFGSCLGVVVAVRLDGPLPTRAAELLPLGGRLGSVIAVDRGDHTWLLAGLVGVDALEARAASLP